MRYFPIFVDLDRKPILIVGGGEQAAQKEPRLLRKTTATLFVVAPALCPELQDMKAKGRLRYLDGPLRPEHLKGCALAYGCSEDGAINARLSLLARAQGVPVNIVDTPQLCTFITPALVDRDPVVIAIGSEGAAPVLVRRIRTMLEASLPARLGRLASLAQGLRRQVAVRLKPAGRRSYWEGFFDGPAAAAALHGDEAEAERLAVESLEAGEIARVGRVSLVGAGPGDPDLLTLKAVQTLQAADVIVADRLVPAAILEKARRDARRIHVGKTPGGPSTPQDEINAILVAEAQAGNRVVRLKGGDPFVFGRAVEEIEALHAAGIAVEVVPGVTAALGAAASARVAVTARGERRALTILTGATAEGPAEHDWQALARPGQALAVYMGVGTAALLGTSSPRARHRPAHPYHRRRERDPAKREGGDGDHRRPHFAHHRPRDQGSGRDLRRRRTARRPGRRPAAAPPHSGYRPLEQPAMTSQALTANRLDTGDVVFLGAHGWTPFLAEAEITADATSLADLERRAKADTATRVVEPYAIEVADEAGSPVPVKLRERLRTLGPSIRTDLGYQAASLGRHP